MRVIGTQIDVINATEDRDIFAQKLAEINEKCATSHSATTMEATIEAANKIG